MERKTSRIISWIFKESERTDVFGRMEDDAVWYLRRGSLAWMEGVYLIFCYRRKPKAKTVKFGDPVPKLL